MPELLILGFFLLIAFITFLLKPWKKYEQGD